MIRTINNSLRALLFHGGLPPTYWVKSMHTANHLLNLTPTITHSMSTPHEALLHKKPTYDHLRVFGCLCYPNLTATTKHKLEPRPRPCVFLGYAPLHKCYRCLDLVSKKVIVSRHVIFSEHIFPLKLTPSSSAFDPHHFSTAHPNPLPILNFQNQHTVPTNLLNQSDTPPPQSPTASFLNHLQNNLINTHAPRAWYQRFATFVKCIGFVNSRANPSLFVCRTDTKQAHLLVYVDNIILTASSSSLLKNIIATLSTEFVMSDLGPLHYFLGISVTQQASGIHLSQEKYALDIINRVEMIKGNPCKTPVDTNPKLQADVGPPISEPNEYRSLVGALQYLTFIRLDISYAVQQCCLHMHDPREEHQLAIKRILWYLQGTASLGFALYRGSIDDIITDVYMSANPVQHQCAKHIVHDIHFVREKVALGQVRVLHVPSTSQYADIFTKGLPSSLFLNFQSSLCIWEPPASTAGMLESHLLVYVNDIILTASSSSFLKKIIATLSTEFAMSDLGPLHYFLGISLTQQVSGIHLSQEKYALDIINRAGMSQCNPCKTLVDTNPKLQADVGSPVSDCNEYRTLVGAL
ncbi:hypothetical protein V2J09_010925 [Rumex salicifolius]